MDDDTLREIGIDPRTTSTFSNSPSNAEIEAQIQGAGLGFPGLGTVANFLTGAAFGGQGASTSDLAKAATFLGGLYSAGQSSAPTIINPGYSGGIPEVTASRTMLTAPPAGRRPGSGGINYGGDVTYTRTGQTLSGGNGGQSTPTSQPLGGNIADLAALIALLQQQGGSTTPAPAPAPTGGSTATQTTVGVPLYFQKYPDVAAAYAQNNYGLTPAQFAQTHFNKFGRAEGRLDPSALLQQQGGSTTPAPAPAQGLPAAAPAPALTAAPSTATQTTVGARNAATITQPKSAPFGASEYFTANPDVAAAHKKDSYGMTPEQFVQAHYEKFGKAEGRKAPNIGGFATGGLAADGFVIPADVVSHFGNGSSEAGLDFLAEELGAKPIKGEGDGMSDSIPTTIDGKQPARVANDEAFVPPEVVKKLGGGDTERGAKKLYAMMDRIRKARTGTTEQGKQINPEKFMPGGKVERFSNGGTTGTINAGSSLASWAGPYVADVLGKGKALAEMPYQAYTGPLTAGAAPLQEQAFGAASQYQVPTGIAAAGTAAGQIGQQAQGLTYTPVGGLFGTAEAQQYMNPYLEAALAPQLRELTRQSEIQRQADAARTAKAGAFGGSRQAIMESEARRNLLGRQSDVLGQGYATAYDKAMAQFNEDQRRKIQEAQFGSELGLKGLQTGLQAAETQGRLGTTEAAAGLERIKSLADLGQIQRGIEAEGIAADRAQFEEARLNPYKMLQFQQSLLSGLPLASQSLYQPGQSNLQQFAGGFTTIAQMLQSLGLLKR